jgi:hypothetical protein
MNFHPLQAVNRLREHGGGAVGDVRVFHRRAVPDMRIPLAAENKAWVYSTPNFQR